MNTGHAIWLLVGHYFADFVPQINYIGKNKANNKWVLLLHTILYIGVMGLFSAYIAKTLEGWMWFCVITWAFHTFVDLYTSEITHNYHKAGDSRGFWLMIGLDQTIHTSLLILMLPMLN